MLPERSNLNMKKIKVSTSRLRRLTASLISPMAIIVTAILSISFHTRPLTPCNPAEETSPSAGINQLPFRGLNIPDRDSTAETGREFMARISELSFTDREEEVFRAAAEGNIPGFLRKMTIITGVFADANGEDHILTYEVMPDYLAIGNDTDFCRIPMSPHTAQKLADLFGASLLTARLSDHIWANAVNRLVPDSYLPVNDANEKVEKFVEHNSRINLQLEEAGGKSGELTAGIKKDVILSSRIAERPDRVVIYGWHNIDGRPVQPVYSGHIWQYVDYSHGIRLMGSLVFLDGRPLELRDLLTDPVLFRVVSDEENPMIKPCYPCYMLSDQGLKDVLFSIVLTVI